jgi:hypothetical protein
VQAVKEHVLNPSDRAALQGLIPLAGALGAGTIFALFFGGRRRAGFAVFEVFVVIAVLTAVATTAYFCVALLHRNEPISDHELTQTATPLIVAVFFLAFVSVGSRIPGSFMRAWPILALALLGGAAAAWLASAAWAATPDDAGLVAVLILAVGALLGLLAWAADSANVRSERKAQQRHVERLVERGYAPADGTLGLALPRREEGGRQRLGCWTREGKIYLDFDACRRLRDEADERWHAMAKREARPPGGTRMLLRVEIDYPIPLLRTTPSVRLVTASAESASQVRELARNQDGLFDVS